MDNLDEMNKSARSVRVSINNTTSKKLCLKSHPLTSGVWRVQPPEYILPLATIEFGSESNTILGGTEAGSIYGVEHGNDIDGNFEFFWNNPYFGKRGFRRVTPIGFECDFKVVDQNNSTLRFTIKEIDNGYLREVDDIEKEIKTLNTLINEADVGLKGISKMLQIYQSQKDLKQSQLVETQVKDKTKHLEDMKNKRDSLQNEIVKIKQLESDPKFMEQSLSKIRENIDKTVRDRKAMEHMREVYEKQKDVKSIEGLDKQIDVKKNETDFLRKKEQKVIQKIIELKKALGIGGTGVVLNGAQQPQQPAKKRVQAMFQYEKTSEDELSIAPGDIIEVIHEDNDEWLGGSLNGLVGYFPRSFVQYLEEQPAAPAAESTPAEPSNVTEQDFADLYPRARVIYDHSPTDEGELSIKVGDTLAVYSWDDEYWWEGFIGNKSGYFPCNCVEWIEPEANLDHTDVSAYSYYETTGESVPEENPEPASVPTPAPVVVAPTPVVVAPAPTPVVVAPTPVVVKPTTTPAPHNPPAKALPTSPAAKRELPTAPHATLKTAPTTPSPVAPVTQAPVPVQPQVQAPTPDIKKSPATASPSLPSSNVSTPNTPSTPTTPVSSFNSTPATTGGFDKLLQPLLQEFSKQLVEAHQKETQALQQRIAQLEKELKELKESKPTHQHPNTPVTGGAQNKSVTSFATVISKAAPVVKKL